jgi:hypothetical protein
MITTEPIIIGRAEKLDFPELGFSAIPSRIDTGARTSSVWASNIHEEDGQLEFMLFDTLSEYYTGAMVQTRQFSQRVIASSNGISEARYIVKLLVQLYGRKVRASFTLANRSTQVYPVLVGRNILRGKFVVDVKKGKPLYHDERLYFKTLQTKLTPKEYS